MDDFPMPGGPEIMQALAFKLGTFAHDPPLLGGGGFFLRPIITTSFQSFNHVVNLPIESEFPTKSAAQLGWYLSTQSCWVVGIAEATFDSIPALLIPSYINGELLLVLGVPFGYFLASL